MESQLREATTGSCDNLPTMAALPDEVVGLLAAVNAPPLLGAHLRLVHDTAIQLTAWIHVTWPEVVLDAELVAYGAATHDIGKAVHPNELSQPGGALEPAGESLLIDHGVEPLRARFAVTHNDWSRTTVTIEDLLVAVVDKVWKARREEDLEMRLVGHISTETGRTQWEVFAVLDEELDRVAALADERLAFQTQWAVSR